ncbi:hypothetical protein Tsubulata_018536 [Turnera subulata]|uniref:Uncharacterized protein n=1 Tax=Turnera subulata TaxID=218843 RepID=A0A9Q0GFL8_9ROSI|nr:hypothetical protein Tsubulata_018536 [Turnera subulata]
MKRSITWSDEDEDESSSASSSNSDSDSEDHSKAGQPSKVKKSKAMGKSGKHKKGAVDFEELRKYGYKGGLSVLRVPPPKEEEKQDWSWSTGKERRETREVEESYEQRQKTRAALMEGEQLANVQTSKEKKNLSFSQKEKRKRELGQASRGKSYVEEEKRLLRDSGVYSGFDT